MHVPIQREISIGAMLSLGLGGEDRRKEMERERQRERRREIGHMLAFEC